MRIGQPIYHVVTGTDCTGVITELRSWRPVQLDTELWYARILWMPCGYEHEDDDDWFDLKYLRKVGEPE